MYHAPERHPFCDCRIVCQFAVLVTVRQPIFKHLSTAALRPACSSSLSRHRKPAHYFSSTAYVVHPPAFRQPHRQFNHYTTASQPRTNHRQLQPIRNRPSTATPTIFQSSSNHHPHAPRPRLIPSAATRTVILFPPTPRRKSSPMRRASSPWNCARGSWCSSGLCQDA